ncbi:hypothetical protein CPB83DRAFT_837032 [Crepidotus variabilis]|uniref:Uncharacterized protein n=1 Tax=Crepidotus variabilis TaxID=179855 RepID=A0A9P6JNQ7_9AGAR|nr:hypothetical protein CPB83DRAFT_837032 [Crepidotus variabilis]
MAHINGSNGLNLLARVKFHEGSFVKLVEREPPAQLGVMHYNRLPFELEREIFEIAASAYPKCVPIIIRLARRFQKWFEPELYRILRTGEDNVIRPPFLYHNRDPKGVSLQRPLQPPVHTLMNTHNLGLNTDRLTTYGPWVRNILIQNRPSLEIKSILEHCPNVTNLAIWIIHGNCDILLPILTKLADGGNGKLRKLSFDPSYFFHDYRSEMPIPFSLPSFASLTHLEIINATPSWMKWSELAKMPKLTHLGLTGVVHAPLIKGVLKECLKLEVFVIFDLDVRFVVGQDPGAQNAAVPTTVGNDNTNSGNQITVVSGAAAPATPGTPSGGNEGAQNDEEDWRTDCRVVMLKSVKDHLDHWEMGAKGGSDFWVIAEKMRNSRRASIRAANAAKASSSLA